MANLKTEVTEKKMYAKFFEKQKTENWKLQICLSMRDLLVDIRH